MTMMYLVRHGETAWNSDRNRYCGRTDLPLSDVGQLQALRVARALRGVPLETVYVSPLLRSRQTGASIAAINDTPTKIDSRLIEIDFGAWEGLTSERIEQEDPHGRAAWIHDPTHVRAGSSGETGQEVSQRMMEFLRHVAAVHQSGAVAIVGHNTANRLALAATLDAPLSSYRKMSLGNGSISLLEIDLTTTHWHSINNTSHLVR